MTAELSGTSASRSYCSWGRKPYAKVGFTKAYNFVLWFIFTGGLLSFTLARLPYLDYWGLFCDPEAQVPPSLHTAPGECYFDLRGHTKVGMLLHLSTILPAGILVCFQFVPVIRHRLLLLHRINGYLVLMLSVVSNAGAFMLVRHSFGGEIGTQIFLTVLGVMFLFALLPAYVNIKRLQIEQHRGWMLRAWLYVCCHSPPLFF